MGSSHTPHALSDPLLPEEQKKLWAKRESYSMMHFEMRYYAEKLSGHRLMKCYEIAPPRVRRYLDSEIQHLKSRIEPHHVVLELGCGYGRVAAELARCALRVLGIDTSSESLGLAENLWAGIANLEFHEMDATNLKFADNLFDLVACVQNGICAFGVDKERLLVESLRVTGAGRRVIFSSYSEKFWPHRLEWFELQARQGLVGEIDYHATGNGILACKDGFKAGAMGELEFRDLCAGVGVEPAIAVVDESSLFCEIIKKQPIAR